MRGQHPNSRANLRPDNQRGRRSPRMNLWSDGYEDVAERIIVKQRQTGEPYQVHVADDGGVYTSPARKLPTHGPALELIGVYNGAARVEHVEDDLLAWMREHTTVAA